MTKTECEEIRDIMAYVFSDTVYFYYSGHNVSSAILNNWYGITCRLLAAWIATGGGTNSAYNAWKADALDY